MRHRYNLQSALPLVALSGYVAVRAAHVAPRYLRYDALPAETAGAATRVETKASWSILMLMLSVTLCIVAF
jgi:hypothetical protein